MAELLSPKVRAAADVLPKDLRFLFYTRRIFISFMIQRLTREKMSLFGIPQPVLEMFCERELWSNEVEEIGEALAELAEEIDKYRNELAGMAMRLGTNSHTPYCKFERVARGVFRDVIDWGKIVTFFTFGYELVLVAIRRGDWDVKTFWHYIDSFVVAFLKETEIASWIKYKGGWVALLDKPKIDLKAFKLWLERFIIVSGTVVIGIFLFVLKIKPD